jgi:transposase InsO family protein
MSTSICLFRAHPPPTLLMVRQRVRTGSRREAHGRSIVKYWGLSRLCRQQEWNPRSLKGAFLAVVLLARRMRQQQEALRPSHNRCFSPELSWDFVSFLLLIKGRAACLGGGAARLHSSSPGARCLTFQ